MDQQMKEYLEKMETDYKTIVSNYIPPNKKIKGIDQCVIRMARGYSLTKKIWWNSWEFQGESGGLFGSHKAPARISDLSIYYPSYVESREENNGCTVYRLKLEELGLNTLWQLCQFDDGEVEESY